MARNLQEHILKTASELFYKQGIKATGIDSIIKSTGVAKMSLYKYYPSKDDLVLAHLESSAFKLKQTILIGINEEKEPIQKIFKIFDIFEEIINSPNFRGCPFINASTEYADVNHPIHQFSADFYQYFCFLLSDLARDANISNYQDLSKQLAILISGAIVTEQIQKNSGAMQNVNKVAKLLIDTALQ